MPGNKYDKQDTRHIVEGRHEETFTNRAVYGDAPVPLSPFAKFVILEVISDPATLDKTKLSYFEHVLGVSNVSMAAVAPRNSIIGRRVMGGGSGASEKVMVLYPFFPHHLAMPAKPGEHVWAMFEHLDADSTTIGYWMCRVVQPNFVDDNNYTHADRQFDSSFLPGLSDVFEGNDDAKYEFRNGAVDTKNGRRYSIPGTASLPDGERAYENLLTETDAAKITQYEAVPRYRKRPADVALEGSNNTLIVLGTDRVSSLAEYDNDPDKGQVPRPAASDVFDVGAGTIDIVVGRGQTPDTGGKVATSTQIVGGGFKKELAKGGKDLATKEGDVDLKNDRSRIRVSQKTKVDVNLRIDEVVKAHTIRQPIQDATGEGAISIKSDKVRLVARHDVVIMVTGASETDDNGNVKDPDANPDDCATITIRTNGDIVFTPAKKGLVLIGGDDADLAPLCTRANNGGTGGEVVAQPIIDSMGGAQGAQDGLNGTFARKVLFK